MTNQNFKYILSDCSFTLSSVCNQEYLNRLNVYTNINKIIIIDEYKDGEGFYYIVCFDRVVLIIQRIEIIIFF